MSEFERRKFHFKMNCCKKAFTETMEKIVKACAPVLKDNTELKFRLEMAAREMLANALEHGCSCAEEKIMIVLTLENPRQLKLKVVSPGAGFDWQNIILNYMPHLETEGRGLPMIKIAADELEFNEKGNIITAVFRT